MTGAEDLSSSVTAKVYAYANRIKPMAAGQRKASRIGVSRYQGYARGHEEKLRTEAIKELRSAEFLTIFFDGGKNDVDARANDFLCGPRTSRNEKRLSLLQGFKT